MHTFIKPATYKKSCFCCISCVKTCHRKEILGRQKIFFSAFPLLFFQQTGTHTSDLMLLKLTCIIQERFRFHEHLDFFPWGSKKKQESKCSVEIALHENNNVMECKTWKSLVHFKDLMWKDSTDWSLKKIFSLREGLKNVISESFSIPMVSRQNI